ncbi:carbonic anhydrase 6-like [Galleria mellonella]|uniref:Carbonic anhydrase 6-like n=1 Tax=Galleria mellonella TaxID=7137 RepID=A0ABM3MXC6_GALME|nr:carbonic anhydrase 6-like [Galleria mellonella]
MVLFLLRRDFVRALWYIWLFSCKVILLKAETWEQTSPRANTLYDDADDIQKQLDNEARDRLKYGRPKTIWVFHLPTQFPDLNAKDVSSDYRNFNSLRQWRRENDVEILSYTPISAVSLKDWDYEGQEKWAVLYPQCGGHSQSPVDVPVDRLITTKGASPILFYNYNAVPTSLTLENNGKSVTLRGEWKNKLRPLVYGGAAHSRRYVFHSLTLHWPSEHTVGGLQYPLESQVLHISAEYRTLEEALEAYARDPQAILGIVNLYKFDNNTQKGLSVLLKTVSKMTSVRESVARNPLSYFSPPLKEYAYYQGSLTTPPCTESVMWLIRGRALSVTRDYMEMVRGLLEEFSEPEKTFHRRVQPLNDRKIFFFN